MWTRAELKDNAKRFFKFNYWKMVLVALVLTMVGGGGASASSSYTRRTSSDYRYGSMSSAEMIGFIVGFMVVMLVVMVIGFAVSAFLLNPLVVGAQRFFVVSHYQKAELGELGYAFSNSYMNVVKTMFLKALYVFLWSLLLVVPGIIKGYEYRMIPYILAENPGIDTKDAFAMSKQMMDGNKWNAFVLDLSFIGWNILSLFTCGILAIFYVNPYIYMTDAELYVALKEITFGNAPTGYQNGAGYQNYQQNQGFQNYQGYQPNQGYQDYQPNQGWQNSQEYQNVPNNQQGQNYQSGTGYQDMNQQNGGQSDNGQPDDNFRM
ncbi:MAG: DUF975 family protein [Lachnospiraceae bacterium]|nr:DUF975 family protein [Lachnospiraceae bacterium]